jgi:tyrosyl-tRNA synthetase
MIGLTGGKMSSSIPESRIMIDESPEDIRKKIINAYCPEKQTKENPILHICQYVLFGRINKLKIERDTKYGGDLIVKDYRELENLYASSLHPLDLKKAVAESLIQVLKPARERLNSRKMLEIKDIIKTLN